MLDKDAIEINNILKMVDTYRLNDVEIRRIDYKKFVFSELSNGYFKAAQFVLAERAKTNYQMNESLKVLEVLAKDAGFAIGLPAEIVPKVNVMYVGGSL